MLELVEGPTLADRIPKGPIPLDKALTIAKQIAEALEDAHEAGVIHRDLKSANIKVREDGTVKVLDFGLAKALEPDPASAAAADSPTISLTAAMTQMGMVIGTAAYMAPEQAKGQVIDKRVDVWALGAVLFEVLTGAKAFPGDDVSETLATVLKFDPNWDLLPTETPAAMRRVMRRCLAKDPKRRLREVGSAILDLDDAGVADERDETQLAAASSQSRRLMRHAPALALAVFAAVASGATVWNLGRPDLESTGVMRFEIVPPDDQFLSFGGNVRDLVVSPDGAKIVYKGPRPTPAASGPQLYLRSLDQLEGAPLQGTQSTLGQFVSPDSQWVGFTDMSQTFLRRVPILGGTPVTLTETQNQIFGASWGTDDWIIFGTAGAGLFRVPATGGDPEPLTTLDTDRDEGSHVWPAIIEEAHVVLFVIAAGTPPTAGQLAVLDLDTGAVTRLGVAGASPHYVPTGHVVYAVEDGSVRAVPFDAASLEVTGNPVSLIDGVMVKRSGAAAFSVSSNGRLVYALSTGGTTARRSLVWVDRTGQEEPLAAPVRMYVDPRISPDGSKIAVGVRDDDNNDDVWVWDLRGNALTRLTFDATPDRSARWTADGQRIVFSSQRAGANDIYWKAADGTGAAERVTESALREIVGDVVPDGSGVIVRGQLSGPGSGLVFVPFDSDETTETLVDTEFDERNPALSPDGQWLAFASNASGQYEVYVRPFPDVAAGLWQVSTAGGRAPAWGRSGDELFYVQDDRRMMATSIQTSPSFSRSTPEILFEGDYLTSINARQYDVAPDGRFVMMKAGDQTSGDVRRPRITVVLDWFEELLERVPVP